MLIMEYVVNVINRNKPFIEERCEECDPLLHIRRMYGQVEIMIYNL